MELRELRDALANMSWWFLQYEKADTEDKKLIWGEKIKETCKKIAARWDAEGIEA